MKIGIERIVNKDYVRVERFVCSICSNLLINMRKCSLCNSHFCFDCITRSNSKYCPKCNMVDFQIEEGEQYLNRLINEIFISCVNKGCDEVYSYSNAIDHEAICKFKAKVCDNCSVQYSSEKYYLHLIKCYEINEEQENAVKQRNVLNLIKAFDEKLNNVKYESKLNINSMRAELQKNLNKLDEKIRSTEKYIAEQDYLIRAAELEKYKSATPFEVIGRCLKECQIYYYCKGSYNGCNKAGNVWGSNPYTSDSVICLAALHSGHMTKEGGLFVVKKGGPLESYMGSVKNGISTQAYGTFDHLLIFPSELDIKLSSSTNQCGPRIGICKGKANNCIEKGDVWGDNPYVRESNLCKAALHCGLITENGGIFMIEETGTNGAFPAVTRNSITSLPCSSNRSSVTIKPFLPY